MQRQANTALLHPTLHTSHSPCLSSSHLIPSLLTFRPSKFFSTLIRALINLSHLLEVLLNSFQLFRVPESSYYQREVSCTKKHCGQKAFPHRSMGHRCIYTERPLRKYFVLQSLHKALLGTTMYYKACTKHFPVLLCTTKLAQSTSQYYFVLQSLHKVYTSQYYFALQSLHKVLPIITLYYKTSTKHVPVLLCTT